MMWFSRHITFHKVCCCLKVQCDTELASITEPSNVSLTNRCRRLPFVLVDMMMNGYYPLLPDMHYHTYISPTNYIENR